MGYQVKLIRLAVLLAALLLLSAIGTGAASATTVNDCQTQLATLRADTVAAQTSFTNQADFDGLVAKLDAASAKLAAGKNGDAVQKLVDFQSTLNALATAAKPKVDPGVAQSLIAEAQGVIDCINAIGTA
jgi:alkyl sulfatase BDS1-like metallo-beta-lactamase superfamily hydrolase